MGQNAREGVLSQSSQSAISNIIGPSPRIDDRVRSVKALVESCIKKHNLDDNIEVTESNIPYNRE